MQGHKVRTHSLVIRDGTVILYLRISTATDVRSSEPGPEASREVESLHRRNYWSDRFTYNLQEGESTDLSHVCNCKTLTCLSGACFLLLTSGGRHKLREATSLVKLLLAASSFQSIGPNLGICSYFDCFLCFTIDVQLNSVHVLPWGAHPLIPCELLFSSSVSQFFSLVLSSLEILGESLPFRILSDHPSFSASPNSPIDTDGALLF